MNSEDQDHVGTVEKTLAALLPPLKSLQFDVVIKTIAATR
jgi:hypothetical protein